MPGAGLIKKFKFHQLYQNLFAGGGGGGATQPPPYMLQNCVNVKEINLNDNPYQLTHIL